MSCSENTIGGSLGSTTEVANGRRGHERERAEVAAHERVTRVRRHRDLHVAVRIGELVRAEWNRCRDALVDPAFRHTSVSEIAYEWGFNDAAHFSRTFKVRFGVSPRGLRHHGNRAS